VAATNNIKPWLEAKLKARGITAHKFASEMRVTSATIYRWYSDQYRPTPLMMKRVCETLSRIPVKLGDDQEVLEEVSWDEGMDQYSSGTRFWVDRVKEKEKEE
jgi:transcriptional regulator with XRE-family HTH domain